MDIDKENDVLVRTKAKQPLKNTTNHTRQVDRKLRGDKEIDNKNDAVSYVNRTNRQMNTYNRSTPTETDDFISDDQ